MNNIEDEKKYIKFSHEYISWIYLKIYVYDGFHKCLTKVIFRFIVEDAMT